MKIKKHPMRIKILVIEDDKVLADVLYKKLRADGYHAILSYDGEDGLEKIKKEQPALVLLDIILPKKDGYQVLEEMRDHGLLSKIPVIIISNSGQPVEIDRAMTLGARDYLVKADFDPDEIIQKVERALEGKKIDEKDDEQNDTPTILLVEDDKFLKDLASRKFQNAGYRVIEALDGEEALQKAARFNPKLILLDIILPGIDGFEVLQKLRSQKAFKNTPIVLLSNLGQKEDIQRGLDLGADDYLIKAHYTLDEIMSKVKKYLKG